MRGNLFIGTNSFLVGLQTKIVQAILTFCPIFCYLSHCVLLLKHFWRFVLTHSWPNSYEDWTKPNLTVGAVRLQTGLGHNDTPPPCNIGFRVNQNILFLFQILYHYYYSLFMAIIIGCWFKICPLIGLEKQLTNFLFYMITLHYAKF